MFLLILIFEFIHEDVGTFNLDDLSILLDVRCVILTEHTWSWRCCIELHQSLGFEFTSVIGLLMDVCSVTLGFEFNSIWIYMPHGYAIGSVWILWTYDNAPVSFWSLVSYIHSLSLPSWCSSYMHMHISITKGHILHYLILYICICTHYQVFDSLISHI